MLDAQGMVFFIAGYETTATTLQSAVYLLAKNPDVQDQLHEEVINICESSNKINHETITVRKCMLLGIQCSTLILSITPAHQIMKSLDNCLFFYSIL